MRTVRLGDRDTKTSFQLVDHIPGSGISGKLPIGTVSSSRERTTATDDSGLPLPLSPRSKWGKIAGNTIPLPDTIVVQLAD